MWQRFTEGARRVILQGQEQAINMNSGHVGTEHLLLGLARENDGVSASVLEAMGVSLDQLRAATLASAATSSAVNSQSGEPKLMPKAKRVLEMAADEARRMRHNYIGTEHLLLALLREKDGVAAKVLRRLGLNLEKARAQVTGFLDAEPEAAKYTPSNQVTAVFSSELGELLSAAEKLKKDQGGDIIEIKDVLRALCLPDSAAEQLLRELGVEVEALRAKLDE